MPYATLRDIFQRWGETNVRDAANLNADDPKSATVASPAQWRFRFRNWTVILQD
jgi:hypothetical protein